MTISKKMTISKERHWLWLFFIICINEWIVLEVLAGCRRTNPGWINEDVQGNIKGGPAHPTAPIVSYLPGNWLQDWCNETLTHCNIYELLINNHVSIFYTHNHAQMFEDNKTFKVSWNELLVTTYPQCYDTITIWSQLKGECVYLFYLGWNI